MQRDNVKSLTHTHTFGQDVKRPAESHTLMVAGLTAIMMGVEIAGGVLFGSMALLADGLHMASHAVALGLNVFAYSYARRHAGDLRFSFGTGKVNALGGYTGAVLLATFAALMCWESTQRFLHPNPIAFDQAILVAVLGLVVNGISVFVLNHSNERYDHKESHHAGAQHDHNLRSAYLHVLADALTSVLAIAALLCAKYFGWAWMDPAMGIVGAVLVARWSLGLVASSSSVLLDQQAPARIRDSIRSSIEVDGDSRVADLHVWAIGPNVYAAIISIVARDPHHVALYRTVLPKDLGLEHVTIEVCQDDGIAGSISTIVPG
jgi:cation diffusion facilitator family transporter